MVRKVALVALIALSLPACRDSSPPADPAAEHVPAGSATAPTFERPAETVAAKAPAEAAPATETADAPPAEPEANEEPEAKAEPQEEPAEALPAVDVRNVGMHIGGEKNTKEQKRPIRETIGKHYDAMKRCWAKAPDPPKKGTFGVDIRIEGEGGPAKITNPRNGLKSSDVTPCMMAVFEAIEFPPQPHKQDRMVSYSVEFTRK